MDHASVSGGTHSKAVRTAWFAMEKTGLKKAPPSAKWSHRWWFQWETESQCMETQVHKLWKLSRTEILLLKKHVKWRQLMFFWQVYVSIISEFGHFTKASSKVLQVLFCKVLEKWSKLTTRASDWQSPCVMTQLSAIVYHEKSQPAKNGRKNCHHWG